MRRGVHACAVLALAAAVGVSACGKKKPAPPPPTPPAAEAPRTTTPPPPPAPAPPPRETPPPAPTEEEIFRNKSLADLNAEHPLGDAFFELDSAQLGGDAQPILQKDADWMKRWTSTKISVEGHCDSRGTAEYN